MERPWWLSGPETRTFLLTCRAGERGNLEFQSLLQAPLTYFSEMHLIWGRKSVNVNDLWQLPRTAQLISQPPAAKNGKTFILPLPPDYLTPAAELNSRVSTQQPTNRSFRLS